jgi:type I restriction enzyme R subunit
MVEQENWDAASRRVVEEMFNKPDDYFTLERLRRSTGLDRRLTVRELIEKAFGHIERFKTRDELINDEFDKFLLDQKPEQADRLREMRYFFDAYIKDPDEWRKGIPEYIKDYVPLNTFMP